MRKMHVLASAAMGLMASAANAAVFTDNFSPTQSPLWSNALGTPPNNFGNWVATNGHYYASQPSNVPVTISALPFDMTDYTVSVNVTALADGGIWLRTDGTDNNGILLVFGGNGYGPGNRGGNAGTSLYFHRVINGGYSSQLAEVDGVFAPETDHSLSVVVSGDSYAVSVDGVLKTTLTDSTYPHGEVGLYDEGPNSLRVKQSFSNFVLTSNAVPEPGLMAVALPAATLLARRRR